MAVEEGRMEVAWCEIWKVEELDEALSFLTRRWMNRF